VTSVELEYAAPRQHTAQQRQDLGAAGVPILGERGEGGGYQLLDGYRTNLTGLTSDEASALLLTGAAAPVAQLGLGSLLATTRLKLLAAVPSGLREVATRAEARFLLDPSGWAHARPRDQRHLHTIARAVWQDRQLRLAHRRLDGHAVQCTVHPLGMVHKTGTWYLVAAHRQRPLAYRVERVTSASVLDAPAERPPDFVLGVFWDAWELEYAASLPTFVATVRLGPRAASLSRCAGRRVAAPGDRGRAGCRGLDSPGARVRRARYRRERVARAGP
jgi:predicted DNA-binding transcriptional regulator YafY